MLQICLCRWSTFQEPGLCPVTSTAANSHVAQWFSQVLRCSGIDSAGTSGDGSAQRVAHSPADYAHASPVRVCSTDTRIHRMGEIHSCRPPGYVVRCDRVLPFAFGLSRPATGTPTAAVPETRAETPRLFRDEERGERGVWGCGAREGGARGGREHDAGCWPAVSQTPPAA